MLETGGSPTVELAIEASDRRADIQWRVNSATLVSRAEVRRILSDPHSAVPPVSGLLGDLQMHSEWSDGAATVQDIANACLERGYQYSAVADH